MHERFDRLEWVFRHDFTGALAKWLVKLSPYSVPDNFEWIITEFECRIPYDFDKNGMAKVSLATMTSAIYEVLEKMPDVMALNVPKSGHTQNIITSRYHDGPSNPDDDFIDIMALARNITCEFADKADAECWLERKTIPKI